MLTQKTLEGFKDELTRLIKKGLEDHEAPSDIEKQLLQYLLAQKKAQLLSIPELESLFVESKRLRQEMQKKIEELRSISGSLH